MEETRERIVGKECHQQRGHGRRKEQTREGRPKDQATQKINKLKKTEEYLEGIFSVALLLMSRVAVLSLYRHFIRSAKKFTVSHSGWLSLLALSCLSCRYPLSVAHFSSHQDYNFRSYALRRVRTGFRENKSLQGTELNAQYQFGVEQLKVVER
jgi:hypothetical protein